MDGWIKIHDWVRKAYHSPPVLSSGAGNSGQFEERGVGGFDILVKI